MNSNKHIIEVKNIDKHFGRGKRRRAILNSVSFSVTSGEIFGIFGNNGAGKSTLLRIIAGQLIADSGTCRIDGVDVTNEPENSRSMIGLCGADENSFYGRLTGRQNLRFFGRLYGQDRELIEERATRLLKQLDLLEHADRPVQIYSTGLKQRLNVARTLIHDPPVLIMDEVTKAADPGTADLILDTIRNKWVKEQGKTVVYVSQDLFGAESLCHRIAILNGGKLSSIGTVQDVLGETYTSIRHLLRSLKSPQFSPGSAS